MQSERAEPPRGFFPVPLAIMRPGTLAPVHLYLLVRPPAGFILYKTARTPLSEETRDRLVERGTPNLHVREKDADAYYEYVEEHIIEILKDDLLPPEEASQLVYEGSSRVMSDVFHDPRSGRNVLRAHRMVEAAVHSILKDPGSLWLMTEMASHDYHTYTHCVNVCMFLVSASTQVLDITDTITLERIGLGGILHDVGKSVIPEEILTKPGKLTPREFQKVKEHPTRGLEIVQSHRRVSPAAAQVILCHHERLDGAGYPRGLAGQSISKISRLAAIADVYDALTTKRAYAPASEPYQALDVMLREMDGHFDMALLRSFVRFLGPREARGEPQRASGASP